jgi:SAM-dependent methyltransferase
MMFGFRNTFEYFKCAACGCLQITEPPEDIARYYPPNYYSLVGPFPLEGPAPALNPFRRIARRHRDECAVSGRGLLGRLLYSLWPNVPLRKNTTLHFPEPIPPTLNLHRRSKILDIGCGSGRFLRTLHSAGFESLLGVDPNLEADVDLSQTLRLRRGTIHGVTGIWDLIMFHHSFEHLADPLETLMATSERLAPRGVCLIRIPLASSAAWEEYGTHWVQLDAPRHFFLHTGQSFHLLTRTAGLRVDTVVWDSTGFQFWGSEQYARDIPLYSERSYLVNPAASIFSSEQIAAFDSRAHELNTRGRGDQAAFCLRKP